MVVLIKILRTRDRSPSIFKALFSPSFPKRAIKLLEVMVVILLSGKSLEFVAEWEDLRLFCI